ncbi:uncharacterized protein LOC121378851 [Gigantopelta aegis]|uniref:uncharacterized protein LOC121378851 n=1 Tax=Gigantopelta aegis TaxID=1735272 RepID=UPI001B88DE36|nr:uncharacterized protein LOC121378851 [Gigantopelta aegis]
MDQSEKDVPAYLDYFAASGNDEEPEKSSEETETSSTEETVDYSEREDDDDYDPTEDVGQAGEGDTSSSDDGEWLPGKRKRNSLRTRAKRRPQMTFTGEPLSSGYGFTPAEHYSGKGGSVGSSQRVGFVNKPCALGGPSKTILRNILETTPAASMTCLSSQKSRGSFFSPCLQALLMKKADAVSVSSKIYTKSNSQNVLVLTGNGQKPNSDGILMETADGASLSKKTDTKSNSQDIPVLNSNGQKPNSDGILPSSSVSVDRSGNIVAGSASSLLVAMLKKAHAHSNSPESLVSTQDASLRIASSVNNNELKGLGHVENTCAFKTSSFNTSDIRLLQENVNSEQVTCDICKRKSSSTVCLRLPLSDNGVADFKQWKVCEWCEVKIVGATVLKDPVVPQITIKLESGASLSTTEKNADEDSREPGALKVISLSNWAPNPKTESIGEFKKRLQHKFTNSQEVLLDSLFGSESCNKSQPGFKVSESSSSQNGDTVDTQDSPVAACTTHIPKGSPKKMIRNVSNSLVKTTNNNSESLLSALASDRVVVKMEPPDATCDYNTCDKSSQQMSNKQLLSDRVVVKLEPPDDIGEHNTCDKSSQQMSNKEMELPEMGPFTQSIVVKQEPVDDYQTATVLNAATCDIHVGAKLQEISSPSNILNTPVNSSKSDNTNQFTSILSQLLNSQYTQKPGNTISCESKINSQDSKCQQCFPLTFVQEGSKTEMDVSSNDQHLNSIVHKTPDDRVSLASSSLPFCEKEQIAQSSIKNSIPQNELLSMLKIPIKQEQADFTDCSSVVLPSIPVPKDSTTSEFTGFSMKNEPIYIIESSEEANTTEKAHLIKSTQSHSYPILQQTDSSLPECPTRSEFWASDLLLQNSQSPRSSMPKSSSLLLQQLCRSHETQSASSNEDSSLLSHGYTPEVSPRDDALWSLSLVQALNAPATYNLSDLLRQLSRRSSKMNNPTNSGSVISPRMDTTRSAVEHDSFAVSLDKAQIPTGNSQSRQSSHNNNINGSDCVDLTIECNDPDLPTKLVSQAGRTMSEPVAGIQPRNVFHVGKSALSGKQQAELTDSISSRTRTKDDLPISDVAVHGVSSKSKHNSKKDLKCASLNMLVKLRPFVCMRCSESFTTSRGLKIHMQSHEQDKVYGCGICGRKYSTNGVLKKHILTYHGPIGQKSEDDHD